MVIGVLVTLFYASYTDLKTRTIPRYLPIITYGFVAGYIFFAGKDPIVASICFGFTFIAFLCVWGISWGQFGIGDVLILAGLGWMVADIAILKAFLIVLGVMTIPYGLFMVFLYRKQAKFKKKYANERFAYPYMPLIFTVTMLYVLFPSIFITLL